MVLIPEQALMLFMHLHWVGKSLDASSAWGQAQTCAIAASRSFAVRSGSTRPIRARIDE